MCPASLGCRLAVASPDQVALASWRQAAAAGSYETSGMTTVGHINLG